MTYYNRRLERQRRDDMTPDKIVSIAQSKGEFAVSLRYRDDWLRDRCETLRRQGKLRGGRRDGRHLMYYPASGGAP